MAKANNLPKPTAKKEPPVKKQSPGSLAVLTNTTEDVLQVGWFTVAYRMKVDRKMYEALSRLSSVQKLIKEGSLQVTWPRPA